MNLCSALPAADEAVEEAAQSEDGKAEFSELWKAKLQENIDCLEDITRTPGVEQEKLLAHILEKHAKTEYLQKHGLNGATDVASFRKCIPVSDYESIEPYFRRIIHDGDTSPILFADPLAEVQRSSGTTSGVCKLFPITEEELRLRGITFRLMKAALSRAFPSLKDGKATFFYYASGDAILPHDITVRTAVTSFIRSAGFRERDFDPAYRLTTPDQAFVDNTSLDEVLYTHFLCTLLQRQEVFRLGSIFAHTLTMAMRSLGKWWPELCEDIRNGTISASRVTNDETRKIVLSLLRADARLANSLAAEFSKTSWEGIITRIWPNLKCIDTVTTGAMAVYVPNLVYWSGNLPIINTQMYACTEGFFGINCTPDSPLGKITYTLIPIMAYYEFIPVIQRPEVQQEVILDLTKLELGHEYKVLVTTVSGLYRFLIGDILKVVGFYNATPSFKFMRRLKSLFCLASANCNEGELHVAVTNAIKLLGDLGLRLHDYTSTTDMTQKMGHYVIFWELATESQISVEVLQNCCEVLDTSISEQYLLDRRRGYIGPIELRILKSGTFANLTDLALSNGASYGQYKTPKGIPQSNTAQLQILEAGTVQRHQLHQSFE